MTSSPAQTVRQYLDQQGGEVVVPFHNLLTTWGANQADPEVRIAIERDLQAENVEITPGLRWVGPDTPITLRVSAAAAPGPPPWAADPEEPQAPGRRLGVGAVVALVAVLVLLASASAVVGYVLGRDSETDLEQAEARGKRAGEREAAARQDPSALRKARSAGRREGYRRAYQPAFDRTKSAALSAAPKSCGDARKNETPVVLKVRAQGVDCATALALARGCQNPEAGCQGYSCDAVSIAWESSEITCTSSGRTIRFISAV
jgi:hypothetical protein